MKQLIKYLFMITSVVIIAGCSQLKLSGDNKSNNVAAGLLALVLNSDTWFFVSNSTGADIYAYKHGSSGNSLGKTITLPATSSGEFVGTTNNHVFVAMADAGKVGVIDVSTGTPELATSITAGIRPNHMYLAPDGKYLWVMNDGNSAAPDKGADTTNCNSNQASVTVIKDGDAGATGSSAATFVKTICVGRGHHKAAFSSISPLRAFVSNITDGTITVIDADSASSTFLNVVTTLSLCDSAKEAALGKTCPSSTTGTTNSSAPHGIDYSSESGKIYNSNTGYGTVSAIHASTLAVETIAVGYTGTLHASNDKKYMLLKGTDKTTDSSHIYGKMNAIRVSDHVVKTVSYQDVNPDHFMFTPDGTKLYVVSSTSGSGTQLTNLKNNVVLVYDTSNLPEMTFVKEITVGKESGSHRSIGIISHNNIPMDIIIPNGADMTLSVIDYVTNTVKQTIGFTGTPKSVHVHGSHNH